MSTINDPTSRLLATRLRALRTERDWTLVELAGRLPAGATKLTGPLIGRIENGARAVSMPELDALADALDVVPAYLMRQGAICDTCGQEVPQ